MSLLLFSVTSNLLHFEGFSRFSVHSKTPKDEAEGCRVWTLRELICDYNPPAPPPPPRMVTGLSHCSRAALVLKRGGLQRFVQVRAGAAQQKGCRSRSFVFATLRRVGGVGGLVDKQRTPHLSDTKAAALVVVVWRRGCVRTFQKEEQITYIHRQFAHICCCFVPVEQTNLK